jgi:hypothetical protein
MTTSRRKGMVNIGAMVHNEPMAQNDGWFSSTGDGDNSRLTDEQRRVVEERIRSRGQLLGVVQVKVFENDCEPFVTFPGGASLGVETDQSSYYGNGLSRSHPADRLAMKPTLRPGVWGHPNYHP